MTDQERAPAVSRPFPQAHVGDDDELGTRWAVVSPLASQSGMKALGGRAVVRADGPTSIVRPDRYTYAEINTQADLAAAMAALQAALRAPAVTGP
jgi:hypothetical protein